MVIATSSTLCCIRYCMDCEEGPVAAVGRAVGERDSHEKY